MELFRTTPESGTYLDDMVAGIRTLGVQASYKEHCTLEDIERFTSAGRPVVALGQVWRSASSGAASAAEEWGSGHYFVVLGTDKDNVYFQDPYLGMCKGFVPRDVFEDHWHQIMDGDVARRELIHVGVFIHGDKPAAAVADADLPEVDLAKLDFQKLGSINLLVLTFPGLLLPFDFLDSLRDIWESGVVRTDAFIILRKDEKARLAALEGGRVGDGADLAEINALVAGIAAQSVSNPVSARSKAEAAARAAASGDFGLSVADLREISKKLPNNHTAIIAFVENIWERRLRAEAAKRGGKIMTQRIVTADAIVRTAQSAATVEG
jgi:hypothetical protein